MFIVGLVVILLLGSLLTWGLIVVARNDLQARNLSVGIDKSDSER